jgi:ankyrin repeat protein
LLEYGAKVDNMNPKDEDGNTPLLLAIEGGHAEVVEFLLDRRANMY